MGEKWGHYVCGWGMAEGKTSKMVVACDTLRDAEVIERTAKTRPEMKFVNICTRKPYYNKEAYITSYKNFSDLGNIWKEA